MKTNNDLYFSIAGVLVNYNMKVCSLFLIVFVGLVAGGVPHQDRVHDQKLSEKEPGSPDYDHEAFLGKDDASEFDELSPDESKKRLGIIVQKIDKNSDQVVSVEELKNWITYVQSKYIKEDSQKQLEETDSNQDNHISWDEYVHSAFRSETSDPEETAEYEKLKVRDKKKFAVADRNNDEKLNADEYVGFLHPEERDYMKGVVAEETLDEMDKNKDGFVDLEEYVGDMIQGEEGGEEPEWVATERELFSTERDTDHDGKLSLKELQAWIMPDDYNHADAEAKHLIEQADDNKDGNLTPEEILEHHDVFAGSQATDWGEALKRHDEF